MNNEIRAAALDRDPIDGLTHRFYRYPARFSPAFARSCIKAYSKPGDVVLDPYMGGGTTVLEAFVLGRRAVGSDISSLAAFVARVKVSDLSRSEQHALTRWATAIIPRLRCNHSPSGTNPELFRVPRNMTIPSARWLRKTISLSLDSISSELPTGAATSFARCVLLNVGQWALNGRKRIPSAVEFRARISSTTLEMLAGTRDLARAVAETTRGRLPVIRQNDVEAIHKDPVIRRVGPVDLVVASPPYPGIHMLYHRWQVDGRKETDVPFWIASCQDGEGAAHYNFVDYRPAAEDRYFEKAERAFAAIRRVMRPGAVIVQMIAFSDPERQLRRYLGVMDRRGGFREQRAHGRRRIWRGVPNRSWHPNLKGQLPSSREVVLIHAKV